VITRTKVQCGWW